MIRLWQSGTGWFYVLHGPRLKRRTATKTRDRAEAEAFLAKFKAELAERIVMQEEPKRRRQRIPTGELRDRNTIRMVADYWGVSTTHVRRLIEAKELACLQLGGAIRIMREQVEACEVAHLREATREDAAADRMRAVLDQRRRERAVLRARQERVKADQGKV